MDLYRYMNEPTVIKVSRMNRARYILVVVVFHAEADNAYKWDDKQLQ
jgi:hypothetical protein